MTPAVENIQFNPAIGSATQGLGEYLVSSGQLPSAEGFLKIRGEAIAVVQQCKRFDASPGKRTGLVVGYVQSGKTMSMVTVASLARDNGCRIVILLAGITTNLLRQNARRFRDTLRAAADGREDWLIVNSEDRNLDLQALQQAVSEWRDKTIPSEYKRTIFFAVLKNHTHLRWLRELLVRERLGDISALVLDDEADQASLNIGENDDPSTIYRRIDEIRKALPNHTYLQYTATPQAPLLISIDDMLSPDFAELVSPGDGYTGGLAFFPEKEQTPNVRLIPAADLFKPGNLPSAPPPSLLEALAVFFVGCAIARRAGTPKTRSMLIHPSQLNKDHDQFLKWAQEVQKRWNSSVADVRDPDHADTLEELELGYKELARTSADLPPFPELLPHLRMSLSRTLTKKVNSEDGSEVDWENGGDHILVGGEKLNRGYTVEGLMVTYMPRDSGGWNADTIQQRARFFGYKKKYQALCRVYLHPDVYDAYKSYVVHERDVRDQLARHRGRPLREWRRAFFLDAKLKPTRANVLSDPLYRVAKDKHWFVQRYPHVDDEAVLFNQELVQRLQAKLESPHRLIVGKGVQRTFEAHFTTIDVLLKELLLDYRAPYEMGTWYGHLVTLSDLAATNPNERVLVVEMGGPRTRSADKKTNALTLHQGRSSKADGGVGDKEIIEEEMTTLQIHRIQVIDGPSVIGLALYLPKVHDAIVGGTIVSGTTAHKEKAPRKASKDAG